MHLGVVEPSSHFVVEAYVKLDWGEDFRKISGKVDCSEQMLYKYSFSFPLAQIPSFFYLWNEQMMIGCVNFPTVRKSNPYVLVANSS